MNNFLDTDISYLTGVGPKKADILKKEADIRTFGDLMYYFPFRYIDKTKFYKISELSADMSNIQITGKITAINITGQGRGQRLNAIFTDGSGIMDLVWFKGVNWIRKTLLPNKQYIIFGKPTFFNGKYSIAHPEIDELTPNTGKEKFIFHGAYYTTEKMKNSFLTSKGIQNLQMNLLRNVASKIEETLPTNIINNNNNIGLRDALINIHFPISQEMLQKASFRLKFEELFLIQMSLIRRKLLRQSKSEGHIFSKVGNNFNNFYKDNLPFDLTGAQKRVLKEIRKNTVTGKQMNRLLQGDVGSGKTLVALMTMLLGIDNDCQAAIMAPTEILATQHYKTICEMLNGMPVTVELLTGSTRKKKRETLHTGLRDGSIQILIGTHALIEDTVQFNNLGIVVIDEQHRFGVIQRAKLWNKNVLRPHVLVMTATPIPRTLSMTLYGDLDVSIIDELPPGRKPIETKHYTDAKRRVVFGFMKEQIDKGRQIYVVYPLIKESEKLDIKDLEDGYESITRAFPLPEYKVSIVHGKMKAKDKEYEMQRFAKGETNIMVATTVIEVGVNVPNASVMVIESTERFGLSQLHQLRGRVGRGAEQSFCILMSSYKLSKESKKRIETMVRTNDGFDIAEVDLKLRGPGDMDGTAQSGVGFDLKIANLAKDTQILQIARDNAIKILDDDPMLDKPENRILKQRVTREENKKINYREIS